MTLKKTVHSAILAAAMLAAPRIVIAQDTQPSVTAGEALSAKITAVKGIVQVRSAEDQPWQTATVGMELSEGSEFRTGPRSAVQFVIPPDQTITLDRLGTIKVLEAIKNSGKVTTSLGMKYGRTRYDIQAADLEHDSSIRSPGSTLAIRGTDVTFEDSAPFAPSATSREGRATFKNAKRQTVAFGGKARANVTANRASPAETAVDRTRTDPQSGFAGRNEKEKDLVTQLPSLGGPDRGGAGGGGIPGLREKGRQDAIRDNVLPPPPPPPPPPGPEPEPTPTPTPVPEPIPTPTPPPGPSEALQFNLNWTGDALSDLDLAVSRGGGERVYVESGASAPPPPVPSGGRHLGNTRANAAGVGQERVVWPTTFPDDWYLVQIYLRNFTFAQSTVEVVQNIDGQNVVIGQFQSSFNPAAVQYDARHVPAPMDFMGPQPNPPPPPPLFPLSPPTSVSAAAMTAAGTNPPVKVIVTTVPPPAPPLVPVKVVTNTQDRKTQRAAQATPSKTGKTALQARQSRR